MAGLVPVVLFCRVVAMASGIGVEALYEWTPFCLDSFAAGSLAAILVRVHRDRTSLRAWASQVAWGSGFFLIGLTAGLGGFYVWSSPEIILTVGQAALSLFFSSAIVLLVCGDIDSPANRALSSRWLRSVGQYSYAMYLFHLAVDSILGRGLARYIGDPRSTGPAWRSLGLGFATVLVTYVLSRISWVLIESPFLRLKRLFPSHGRGVPV